MREVPARETDVDRQRAAGCEASGAQERGDEMSMTNQESAVLDHFVNRAIENLVQELAGRMTYPEAKRAVRESLMRGIIRNLPQPWPLSMPAAKPNLAQPIDESGFSAGFEVGD